MNLEKVLKVISNFRGMRVGDLLASDLEEIIQALAEPDEGEKVTPATLVCRTCGQDLPLGGSCKPKKGQKIDEMCMPCGVAFREICSVRKRWLSVAPAFAFGDLVEYTETNEPAIIQTFVPSESCPGYIVLHIDSDNNLAWNLWEKKNIRLRQRGFCDVSLKRIRDRLTKG